MSLEVPLASIAETMHKRVCPIYSFDAAGKPHVAGSAIPFSNEQGAFLITAAHVCFSRLSQPVPLFAWADSGPVALTDFRIAWSCQESHTPDVDVALVALSGSTYEALRRSYWFSDPATVSTTRSRAPGIHYMIAGYPFSRNRITTTDLAPPMLATHLLSGLIDDKDTPVLKDKSKEHHFTLTFPFAPMRTVHGRSFRFPKPQGMSGGGIWRIDVDVAAKTATTPQLVGVGIEYHTSREARILVGTRVQAALSLAPDLHHFMRTGLVPTQRDDA